MSVYLRLNRQKLHVEVEGSVGRDDSTCTPLPVTQLRWDLELTALSDLGERHRIKHKKRTLGEVLYRIEPKPASNINSCIVFSGFRVGHLLDTSETRTSKRQSYVSILYTKCREKALSSQSSTHGTKKTIHSTTGIRVREYVPYLTCSHSPGYTTI